MESICLDTIQWHKTILLNPKKGVNKVGLDVRVFSVSAIINQKGGMNT